MGTMERTRHARVSALLAKGEEGGCIELSELNELVDTLGFDEDQVEALIEDIESRDIDLTDDCGRDVPEHVTYANDDLAVATTDALQLFLQEVRRYPLLTAAEEVDLAQADRARRRARKAPDDQLEPAARGLDRTQVPRP